MTLTPKQRRDRVYRLLKKTRAELLEHGIQTTQEGDLLYTGDDSMSGSFVRATWSGDEMVLQWHDKFNDELVPASMWIENNLPLDPNLSVVTTVIEGGLIKGGMLSSSQMASEHKNSLLPAVAELERIYRLAVDLFPDRLGSADKLRKMLRDRTPVIIIQSKGRKSALGWHWRKQWKNGSGDVDELSMSSEYLNRSPEAIAETVIHEMVHHANFLAEIEDVSGHQYHNGKFKELAETVGLTVERGGSRGYAYTDLGDDLKQTVTGWDVNPKAFTLFRKQRVPGQKAPTKLRKWVCDCDPQYGVRVAIAEFDATCNQCGSEFRLAGQHEIGAYGVRG